MWCDVVTVALVELKLFVVCTDDRGVVVVEVDVWWYDWVVGRGCGVVGMEWDGVGWFGVVGDSVVGVEGWEGRVGRLLWGLNGGWMGALGMDTLERVGGFVMSAGGV